MKIRIWLCLIAAMTVALAAKPVSAQQSADIIRGRITGPDSLPIQNANILVTSFMGGINKTAKTDKNGRFSVVFPNGEGDYWVGIAAIGYSFKRFELKRVADEEILIADTKLDKAVARLDTVSVTTNAARVPPPRVSSTVDMSGTDRSVGTAAAGAGQAGNIAAALSTLPGFQLIPGVDGNPDMLSVFGLGPEQNNMSLNGGAGSTGDLPRDANVGIGASTSPWDVSRGQFSGAQVQITTRSGSNYLLRNVSSQFDSPAMQWTDRIGNSTSAQYTRMSPGGSWSGPIRTDRSFYSLSLQYDRRSQDLHTLFNTNEAGLQNAGVSSDSVARLRSVLQSLGIPSGTALGNPTTDQFRQQGAFDFTSPSASSGASYQIAETFNYSRSQPTNTNLMATPAFSGENHYLSGAVIARHTNFFWTAIRTQTWLTASMNSSKTDANLAFPAANVRVNSDLDDGTSTVRNLQFGGNSQLGQNTSTGIFSAKNQMDWFAFNNKHAIKLTTEVRNDWYSLDDPRNRRGTFTFQSLGDLEAGRPAQYTRQLANVGEDAKQIVAGVSLGDAWRAGKTNTVQVVYGIRMDANRFLTRPGYNQAVTDAVGVRNDNVPNKVYFSPRVGVSWTYGQAAIIPIADYYTIGPRAVLRAGMGIYQNVGGADQLGSALNQTGLPGASRTLTCVGPTAPTPDWDLYRTDPSGIPSECADGTSVFASNLPSITLFDKNYEQPRAFRANVNWFGGILDNRFTLTADATYNLGLSQRGMVDLNFNPQQRFVLDNEGNRPVFTRASSIDPSSGLIATRDARLSPEFGRISAIKSDLRSQAAQLSLSLRPFYLNSTRFTWSATYTLMNARDQYNGFSSTAGTPLDRAWGPSSQGSHQVRYNFSYNFWDYVTVSWNGGFQSGTRFTPSVAGDVNGDGGTFNDRAFVFNPANATDPALANAMQGLLDHGPSAGRDCVAKQLGKIAGRNSCTGPWTATGDFMSISLNSMKVWMPPRTRFTIQVQNPLVAADILLHGSGKLHGWGQTPAPDASLLYVRGFDEATQRYKYEVNERFGSTSMQQTTARRPVIVTAGFTLDAAPTRDWQSLRMALQRGRGKPGTKLTEAQIRNLSGSIGIPNPMASILRSRETLRLTRKQADSLSMLSRVFTIKLDSLWIPLATYYNGLDAEFNQGLAHEKFVDAREALADYLIKVAPDVKSLLTSQQQRKLMTTIGPYLEPRYLAQMRAGLVSSGLPLEMMMMSIR